MTTRRGTKEKTPLTEGEIEIISENLAQREAKLKDETAAFQKRCEELEREREERAQMEHKLEAIAISLREDMRREIDSIAALVTTSRDTERVISPHEEPRDHRYPLHEDAAATRGPEHIQPSGAASRNCDFPSRTFEPSEMPRGVMEYPKVSFREATESIPSFDGNNIPLAQFARACRRARDIVPPASEYNLTKLIINRLRGRAYYAVEDEPCDTITQLIDLLNGAFGSPKTIDQYRGELSACYLKAGEHMLDYISRIKDLRTAILDAERREKGILSTAEVDNVNGLTARSFCDGLPLQYRLQMHREHYSRPFEAFSAAKILAKREELDRQRNAGSAPPPRFNPGHRAPDYGRQTDRYRPPPQRHDNRAPPPRAITDGTRASPPRDTRESARYPPDATRATGNNLWCRYCKIPGHEIQECRKRAYNNSLNQRSGNYQGPPPRQDPPRVGQQITQTIRSIEATPEEHSESESSEPEHSHTPPQ